MTTIDTVTVEGTTKYTGLPGTFTCYKIVCRFEPDERVWASLAAHGDAGVVYTVGEPAQAPGWLAAQGYFLTAFETLEQAARYRQGFELAVITAVFECEGLYREPLPPMAPPWALATRQASVRPYPGSCRGWPKGTVMAQRLTLLRRIPEEALRVP
jgi:hypothetical protein